MHGSFQHDITLDVYAQECVVSNGSGLSLTMDMHRGGIFNNLWTNIDLGLGSRPLQSGGSAVRGAHAGVAGASPGREGARATSRKEARVAVLPETPASAA